MNPYAIPLLISAILGFFSAILIFAKNRKSKANTIFALVWISGAIWFLGYFLMGISSNANTALLFSKLAYVGVIFIPAFFYHFTIVFLDYKNKGNIIKLVYLQILIFVAALFGSDFLISGIRKYFYGFHPFRGIIHPAFLVFFITLFVNCLIKFYKACKAKKSVSSLDYNRTRYMLVAWAVASIGALDFIADYGIEYYPLGFLFVLVSLGTVHFAIVKYRLMHIELAIGKTTIFICAQSVVFGIPIMMIFFGKAFLNATLGDKWWIIPLAAFGVLAETSSFLNTYLQRKVYAKRFQKFHDIHEALEVSGRGMVEIDDVEKLAEVIPRYLTKFYFAKMGTKITHVTIFLLDPQKKQYFLASSSGEQQQVKGKAILPASPICEWFTKKRKLILARHIAREKDIDVLKIDDIDYWMGENKLLSLERNMHRFLKNLKREMVSLNAVICVPSFFKESLVGFLLLGNRSEGVYTAEELDLFSQLAANAAVAFRSAELSEIIRKFEEEKAETQKLVATGEMLGSVRHEMGNLINKASTGMQMMSNLFLKGDENKYEELREKIVDNLISAKGIWNHVDEYTKKSKLPDIHSYKLSNMVNNAFSHSKELLEKWKIKTTCEIHPNIFLQGKESLPDIFKHLIINSCYGMELQEPEKEKGGELTISAQAIPELNEVEIIQKDTGTDLTKDIRNHTAMGGELFGEQGKIGGISLFLARRITHDHKGTFDILSNNGKGTKFIVRLPLDSARAERRA